MNYQLASDLAHLQYRELRRQAAARQQGTGYRAAVNQRGWPGESRWPARPTASRDRHLSSYVRRRLGFVLVEAGLHLLVDEAG